MFTQLLTKLHQKMIKLVIGNKSVVANVGIYGKVKIFVNSGLIINNYFDSHPLKDFHSDTAIQFVDFSPNSSGLIDHALSE